MNELRVAVTNRNIDLVKKILAEGGCSSSKDEIHWAIVIASSEGFIDMVEILLEHIKDKYIYNKCMIYAARKGHMNIVKMMLDCGADYHNQTMAAASRAGDKEIIQLMMDLGANDYNEALAAASDSGQEDIIKIMLDKGANSYVRSISYASHWGYLGALKLLLERVFSCLDEISEEDKYKIFSSVGGVQDKEVQHFIDIYREGKRKL